MRTQTPSPRPYFFWDYDITEDEVRQILRRASEVEKAWVITRCPGNAHSCSASSAWTSARGSC